MLELKAFLVEDSPLLQAELIATLEELLPLRVLGVADSEAEALHWLALPGHHVDLLLIDIFLKGGSGLGLLRAVQRLPPPDLPRRLVVLSNYATPEIQRSCLELGADRIFDKSGEIDALILYLRGLLPQLLPQLDPAITGSSRDARRNA
ncbi:response regulator [Kinneretia aquatilis]|uniref:response regulator n=1 Tax=Kinneretia aquatilis TaxID=2070761 RepID=UPI0014950F85|nr:response regulator [Paucibacter aquatile]WIV96187.1 response regulator [Paucibacter aquatile]